MGRARDFRLLEDQRKIKAMLAEHAYLQLLNTKGMPPSEYLLEFKLRGYVNDEGATENIHQVRLSFPEQYPFSAPPKFSFLKGLFHPNVYRNGDVCHGWYLNNWNPAIRIDDLLMDIAKMIAFKRDSYNLKSPANYDCSEEWIEAHLIPTDFTPLKKVANTQLHPSESETDALPNETATTVKEVDLAVKLEETLAVKFEDALKAKFEEALDVELDSNAVVEVKIKSDKNLEDSSDVVKKTTALENESKNETATDSVKKAIKVIIKNG